MPEFKTHDYKLHACPVCQDPLREVENGQNCRTCSSRARVRSMAPLLSGYVAPYMRDNPVAKLPLLAFAMIGTEKNFLSPVFQRFKSVSLFGSYSADHEGGVDIRNLSRYEANSFSGVYGSLLFDYFPEHEQALKECFRVIAPGGIFLTHIAPGRILDGNEPPREHGPIKSHTGYFDYLPEEKTLPDVRVGRDWFLAKVEQAGFKPALIRVHDAVPGLVSEWFVGIKPEKTVQTPPPPITAGHHKVSLWGRITAFLTGTHNTTDGNTVPSAAAALPPKTGGAIPTLGTHDYAISECPVCHDPLREVENGQNCRTCSSRARVRSMAPLLSGYVAPYMRDNPVAKLPLLAFAMIGTEKNFLSPVFQRFKSVSLFGSYSADHEGGVDIRNLSRYEANSFSGVYGSLLFDYFPEHEQALKECFRVIAPGGIFLTHIAPGRILDGNEPPREQGSIKSHTGYFNYLPEEKSLPDVRVGRDWFLTKLEQAGFKPALIRVHDAVPGLVSEWFVGIKPEKTVCYGTGNPDTDVIGTSISGVFRSAIPLGDGIGTLSFELIEGKGSSLMFLEDHVSESDSGTSRELLAVGNARKELLLSCDLGKSWRRIYPGIQWDSGISSVFSLADGGRLIRTLTGQMYHLAADGRLLSRHPTGIWHWHGSQGIGQSLSGTVMYAEYAALKADDGVQEAAVWRYRPHMPEQGWHKVLTLPAAAQPPRGELRHFHVCRPHPQNPSLWILASGDAGRHCRLWTSRDDGDSWREITFNTAELKDMPPQHPRLLRFTSFAPLENGDLLWGTDDVSDSRRAALIRLSLSGDKPTLSFLGWLGKNCIRNITACGNDTFLLISESKHEQTIADCILFDARRNRTSFLALPNISQQNNPVTGSSGSLIISDKVAFFPALGSILIHPNKRGIFRIRIEEG